MVNTFEKCLLCSGTEFTEVYPDQHFGLIKCSKCDFIFFIKIPSEEDLIANYNNYPRTDDISPITIKRYKELLKVLEKYRTNNKIIDIGCGNGHFLNEAKKQNWEAFGTEFTDKAVEICKSKGLSIQKGVLNVSNYEAGSFDCLIFIEVLEHINNPLEELEKFHYLLRKGGVLYITTPNFNSFASKYLKWNWNCIEYPEHLCYYTPKTIDAALSKAGFSKVDLKTSGFSISTLKKKSNTHSGNNNETERYRELAENEVFFSLLKKLVNFFLNIFNLGDTIKAVYTKN
jgi:SAM-dependent methyltransferase